MPNKPATSWRDVLPIHPAAELFPLMSPDELKALGEDIHKKNGLLMPVTVWKAQKHFPPQLLDGRNRLDAMEAFGFTIDAENVVPTAIRRSDYGWRGLRTRTGERRSK